MRKLILRLMKFFEPNCEHTWYGPYGSWNGHCRKCNYPAIYVHYDNTRKSPYYI